MPENIPIELNRVIHGDCLEMMKYFPDNCFDSCVTDPPYGISFMNKHWDYALPAVEIWKELLRVLKPGAHILVACGTRTQHRMAVNIEDAGFDIRDVITWHYGSGFPKSLNIFKAIDDHKFKKWLDEYPDDAKIYFEGLETLKENSEEETAWVNKYKELACLNSEDKQWQGWGTALKPATEFWTLARKPLISTIAANTLQHGCGGLNINACRIPFVNDADKDSAVWGRGTDILSGNYVGAVHGNGKENIAPNNNGRFPANLILSHHPDCQPIGLLNVKSSTGGYEMNEKSTFVRTVAKGHTNNGYGNEKGEETIEQWQCHEDCPVRMMNEQAPATGAYAPVQRGQDGMSKGVYGNYSQKGDDGESFYNDIGGASRFFYCAKADTHERNKGLRNFDAVPVAASNQAKAELKRGNLDFESDAEKESSWSTIKMRQNNHPTVKPIDLMRYLVKLITPKKGLVLDPFAGSGTTCIGAKLELINYIGIELEEVYCKIAEARIAAWNPEKFIAQTLF